MSDLSATQCGCGCQNNCGGIFGRGSGCNSCIWIIILLLLSNNGSVFGNDDCGCGCGRSGGNDCIWIILILLFCCGGNSCCGRAYDGCGCGCGSSCGCGC